MNMRDYWDRVTRRYADRPALECDERAMTYAELGRETNRLANGLLGLGLQQGDRVGVLFHNSINWALADLATMKAGLVHVRLHTKLTVADFEYLVADSGCRAIIGDDDLLAPLRAEADRFPSVKWWIGTRDGDLRLPALLRSGSAGRVDTDAVTPSSLCSIRYTAGTTGRPKGATFTHARRALGIGVYLAEESWTRSAPSGGIGRPESTLIVSPLTHAGASYLYWTLTTGGVTVLLNRPSFDPELVTRTLRERRVTHTFLVPTMIHDLISSCGDMMRGSVLPLRTLMYGAAPMPPPLLEDCRERFGEIVIQSYGLTEANGVLALLHKEDHRVAPTSVGRATAQTGIAVVDPEGNRLPPGEAGEIVGWGPHVATGYLDRPEATAEKLGGGVVRTGDVGVLDEDGYLYLKDRMDDMIISGGLNVYPSEVEGVLAGISGVAEVSVVSRPHQRWGEEVVAVVVPVPGGSVDPGAVQHEARDRLGGYRRPKTFFTADALPKSQSGKVLRREVRQRLAAGEYRLLAEEGVS
ncbi:MAG: AMP-binding protein [Micromonosporaceae bacterium]|nr:AMP-binding protein [Micromonosporaceae bacterium]